MARSVLHRLWNRLESRYKTNDSCGCSPEENEDTTTGSDEKSISETEQTSPDSGC